MTAYRCPGCEYTYDEAKGAPREGFPAGTPFSAIPEDGAAPIARCVRRSISK